MKWLLDELRQGRVVAIPSLPEGLPEEAAAEAEFCRATGLRSHLSIPMRVGGRVTAVLSFAGFQAARAWPEDVITRLSIIGKVFVGAVARSRAEEELQRLRDRLWHADRVTRTAALATALAHELNQPLAAILSNAQAALNYLAAPDLPAADQLRAALEAVVRDDKRAAATLRSMRSFLKRGRTERSLVDVRDAMRDVLQMLEPQLRRQGLRVDAALDSPAWVDADRVQLEQVVLNLALNALEAMRTTPPDERRLAVSVSVPLPGGAVRVDVRDSGPGIPADQLEQVFEPFWSTAAEGLGLGLAICRSIIESHGGEIAAHRNPDRGVTFSFVLPEATERGSVERQALVEQSAHDEATAPGVHALAVIDDDASVREAVSRLLATEGWTVRSFASAEAFLAERRLDRFACLVLDVRMDGLSGLQLYERLRQAGAAAPVVFLSGHDDVATAVEAMKLDAVEFLQKPVADEELFAAIRKALARNDREQREAREREAAEARIAKLTAREREVLRHVVHGRLNKQIADELGISEQTVKQHRGRVMEKLEAASVAELVRLCEASGFASD
jgi:RNA polymerase sigma factor (sigma-70 family)